jgi:branched-chain amino acid aminotransferase
MSPSLSDPTGGLSTHDAALDARNETIKIWINGELVPRAEAKVSVYDSGFLLGDGMWEGLRLHGGVWPFLDEHLDRLFDSCKAVKLDIGLTQADLRAALEATAAANGMTDDAHARLMVTRGPKRRPFQHPQLSQSGPTIVIIAEHSRPAEGLQSQGIRLATVPQVRGLPHAQDPKLNSHSKLNCVLACLQAEAAGADEGLMLDPHGFVNTTNACNFFIVRRGEVWTSTGDYCMNGITRLREELFPSGGPKRGRSLPHRHLRRPNAGAQHRWHRSWRRHARRGAHHPTYPDALSCADRGGVGAAEGVGERWSGQRESNPHHQLGKLRFYH